MLIPYVPKTISKKALQLLLKQESERGRSCSSPTFCHHLSHDMHVFQPQPPLYTPPPCLTVARSANAANQERTSFLLVKEYAKSAACSIYWHTTCTNSKSFVTYLMWVHYHSDSLPRSLTPSHFRCFPRCGAIKIASHPGKYEYYSADLAKYRCYSSVKPFVSMAS